MNILKRSYNVCAAATSVLVLVLTIISLEFRGQATEELIVAIQFMTIFCAVMAVGGWTIWQVIIWQSNRKIRMAKHNVSKRFDFESQIREHIQKKHN